MQSVSGFEGKVSKGTLTRESRKLRKLLDITITGMKEHISKHFPGAGDDVHWFCILYFSVTRNELVQTPMSTLALAVLGTLAAATTPSGNSGKGVDI